MTLRSMTIGALLGLSAIAGTVLPASAQQVISLSIGAGHPLTATWIASMKTDWQDRISARVSAETDYEINWTEAYAGTVCKLEECLEAVETGLLDVAQHATPFEPSKLMAHNFAYFVPFGSPDTEVCNAATKIVYDTVPGMKSIFEEKYNQVFLAAACVSNYTLLTKFPVTTFADLAGHKVQAAGPNMPWYDNTGIVPVQASLNDSYTSLQTGVYEGITNYADSYVSFKHIELAKYHVKTDFGAIPAQIITFNKDRWAELPPEVQTIILEESAAWPERLAATVNTKYAAALKIMDEAGVQTVPFSAEDRAHWASLLNNLPKLRSEEINAAGQPGEAVYAWIAAQESLGHTYPRDWKSER